MVVLIYVILPIPSSWFKILLLIQYVVIVIFSNIIMEMCIYTVLSNYYYC